MERRRGERAVVPVGEAAGAEEEEGRRAVAETEGGGDDPLGSGREEVEGGVRGASA